MEHVRKLERIELTHLVIGMLDDWGVTDADKVSLLALPRETRPRAMRRYRADTPLPDDGAVNERIEHLMGIGDALRTSYPRNAAGGRIWMHQSSYRFDDRTPLHAMVEDGLVGIMAVRVHLDCAYDWYENG